MSLVSIIVAAGKNLEIGKDNDLMWSLPRDMRFFKETTSGHPVIMGRKNWDSIPDRWRPLPNRRNIILSRTPSTLEEGVYVTNDLNVALELAWEEEDEEIFVIGGGQVYDLALKTKVVNRMYITHIEAEFPGAHAFFPKWNEAEWKKTLLFSNEIDEKRFLRFSLTISRTQIHIF